MYFCFIDYPEALVGLAVTSMTINIIFLQWTFQMNGSSPRTRVDIEIRTNDDILLRTDAISPHLTTAAISSLLPLTSYNFIAFVISNVGRSRPSSINGSTLSLSMFIERTGSSHDMLILFFYDAGLANPNMLNVSTLSTTELLVSWSVSLFESSH